MISIYTGTNLNKMQNDLSDILNKDRKNKKSYIAGDGISPVSIFMSENIIDKLEDNELASCILTHYEKFMDVGGIYADVQYNADNYDTSYNASLPMSLHMEYPEHYLHPRARILLGGLIVLLNNIGIDIYMLTNDDLIVHEIRNSLLLSQLGDDEIEYLDFDFVKGEHNKYYKLSPKNLKMFNYKDDGSVKEFEFIKNVGITLPYGDVIGESFDKWNMIHRVIVPLP